MVTEEQAVDRLIEIAKEAVEEYDGEHCMGHTYAYAAANEDCDTHVMAAEVEALIRVLRG